MQAAVIEAEPIEEVRDIEFPVQYSITDAAIAQMRGMYTGMKITDHASYEAVRVAISDVRGRRTSVEKRRKELKARALDYGHRVDAEAKRITGLLEDIEGPLKAEKQIEDEKREAVKKESERKEQARIAGIKKMIEDIKVRVPTVPKSSDELAEILFDLDTMEIGAEFQEFAGEAEAARAESVEKINQAITTRMQWEREERERREELSRLEAIKAENLKAEAERKAREEVEESIRKAERSKLEAERKTIEAEKAMLEEQKRSEHEKIKPIADARFKELKAIGVHYSFGDLGAMPESQYKAMYDQYKTEWNRDQESKRIEAEDKAKKEKAEFERIAKEKAEKEAREKLERETAENEAKEEAEDAERKRQESLKPDKEKLVAFATDLLDLNFPELVSQESIVILDHAKGMLCEVRRYISEATGELK